MRHFKYLNSLVVSSFFAVLVLVGTATAQNVTREYREWQRAQQIAQKEHEDYLRTRSPYDYQQWQAAEMRAQQQYREYQAATNGNNGYYNNGYYNNTYNNGYYNNGYYNNTYNNGYYNNGYYNNTYNNGYNTGRTVYRVYNNGSYYSVDNRGAELLRQAVRNGYRQGYQQGQWDRTHSRSYNYTDDRYYRNGNYGYQSYVQRNQYQYYFREGYERGYEDGYNSTYRYGIRSSNGFDILGGVLNTILNMTQ
jgi:hypothetical protein